MPTSSELKGVITLAELQATPQFLDCSTKMQRWLTVLIETGSYFRATTEAFSCASERQAQIFSYAVRKWPKIRACLNLYLGRSAEQIRIEKEQEERRNLLRRVRRNLMKAEPGSVAAMRLLAQEERLLFGVKVTDDEAETPAPPKTGHRFAVGEILEQDGVCYEVTALAPNGDPITRELGPSDAL
jgi:hypothetical protein